MDPVLSGMLVDLRKKWSKKLERPPSEEELSEMLGIPEDKIRKDMTGPQKHRFSNVRIEGDKIILGTEDELEDIICPTCGATNRVRAGSSDKCNNCGSYLRRA